MILLLVLGVWLYLVIAGGVSRGMRGELDEYDPASVLAGVAWPLFTAGIILVCTFYLPVAAGAAVVGWFVEKPARAEQKRKTLAEQIDASEKELGMGRYEAQHEETEPAGGPDPGQQDMRLFAGSYSVWALARETRNT